MSNKTKLKHAAKSTHQLIEAHVEVHEHNLAIDNDRGGEGD